jgi:hypothetical protein
MTKNLDITNSNSGSNNILKTILIILIVVGIAYVIYYLYTNSNSNSNKKNSVNSNVNDEIYEKLENNIESENVYNNIQRQESEDIKDINFKMTGGLKGDKDPIMNKVTTLPSGPIVGQNDIEHFSQDPSFSDQRNASSFPKEQLSAEELLPQDNSSLWAQVNPSGEGSLKDRNFLQSGYHIGINTVGQTLRNANLQLRSEPPCPQVKVSPWLQATIEPDLGRKPFEIGGCA